MQDRRKRILCVDDHEDTRSQLKVLLELSGYEVVTAASVNHGLILARRSYFDLYLLDTMLPNGTGIALCRNIRAFDVNTPIIFYSAFDYQSYRSEALAAGAQDYLLKPPVAGELEQAIRRRINDAELKNTDAQRAALEAIREDITPRKIVAKSAYASGRQAQSRDWNLKVKACQAFVSAGGTRANFERLWPDLIKH